MRSRIRALGLATATTGLVVLVAAPAWRPGAGADSFGSIAVALLALGTVALGAFQLLDRRVADPERWRPPATERGCRVPAPGEEFAHLNERERTERLRRLAVRSLVEATRCSPAAAEDRLDEGTWTADRVARQYFTDGSIDLQLRTRARLALRGDTAAEYRLARTVRAIRDLREGANR